MPYPFCLECGKLHFVLECDNCNKISSSPSICEECGDRRGAFHVVAVSCDRLIQIKAQPTNDSKIEVMVRAINVDKSTRICFGNS